MDVRVGLQYLEAWLRGSGCVPLYGLMEDAASAEISRAQIWQWLRYDVRLQDGRRVTRELVCQIIDEEMQETALDVGESRFLLGRFAEARALLELLCFSDELVDFLTSHAYETLDTTARSS